jgi:membrane carboxypeptidase/penicillin-binding protein
VRVAEHVGLARVAALGESAGLGALSAVPAMALGAEETSLLDLVGAYTVFPNLGEVAQPNLLRGVVTADGVVAYQAAPVRTRVATAPASYVASSLLEGVIDEGTGRGVRAAGLRQPLGGKTGTTNEERDAWFIGYSPDLVAGVWVGFDDGTPVGLTGAGAALPVWVALMKAVLPTYEPRSFRVPSGVVFRSVDRTTGRTDAYSCYDPMREAFVEGTEPEFDCDAPRYAHREEPPPLPERIERRMERVIESAPIDGVRGFFRRLFGGG